MGMGNKFPFFTHVWVLKKLAKVQLSKIQLSRVQMSSCLRLVFISQIQWIFVATIMKLIFVLTSIFLIWIQQSPGFRLPSPLNYYNYNRKNRITTQEPIFAADPETPETPISTNELQQILKIFFIRNQEFDLFLHQKNVDPTAPGRGPPQRLSPLSVTHI